MRPTASSAVGTSTMLVSRMSTVTAAIRPMTAGGDAEQERADAGVLGDRHQPAVEEDREDECRQEDADRHRSAPPRPPAM